MNKILVLLPEAMKVLVFPDSNACPSMVCSNYLLLKALMDSTTVAILFDHTAFSFQNRISPLKLLDKVDPSQYTTVKKKKDSQIMSHLLSNTYFQQMRLNIMHYHRNIYF